MFSDNDISAVSFNIVILDVNCFFSQGIFFLLKDVLRKYGINNVILKNDKHLPAKVDWIITDQYSFYSFPQIPDFPSDNVRSSLCTVIYDTAEELSSANSKWGNRHHLCRQSSLDIIRHSLDSTFRQFYNTRSSGRFPGYIPFQVSPRLSRNEVRVFHLLFEGYSIADIAHILLMSTKSISGYIARICFKLGLKNKHHLYKWMYYFVQETSTVHLVASTA